MPGQDSPSSPPVARTGARGRWALAMLAVVLLLAGATFAWLGPLRMPFGRSQQAVPALDPTQVLVLRTPGGHLEVSTLVKVEEFGWRSSYTCPWRDCDWLGHRLGTIRAPVHYTYRIPLAETWTLRPDGNGYVLSVPAPQPLLPPAVDLAKAEFRSEKGGLLAPDGAANQALLMRHLGPELERRAGRTEYLRAQAPMAEQTVREFAQKWMREQLGASATPLRVEVRMDSDG